MFYDTETKPTTATPWGDANDATDLGSGILSVSTSSHGGLLIPKAMAKHIPKAVRDKFINKSRQATWAEEDCEMPLAIAFLVEQLDPYRLMVEFGEQQTERSYWTGRARQIAQQYPRYAAVLQHLPAD